MLRFREYYGLRISARKRPSQSLAIVYRRPAAFKPVCGLDMRRTARRPFQLQSEKDWCSQDELPATMAGTVSRQADACAWRRPARPSSAVRSETLMLSSAAMAAGI